MDTGLSFSEIVPGALRSGAITPEWASAILNARNRARKADLDERMAYVKVIVSAIGNLATVVARRPTL